MLAVTVDSGVFLYGHILSGNKFRISYQMTFIYLSNLKVHDIPLKEQTNKKRAIHKLRETKLWEVASLMYLPATSLCCSKGV